MKALKTISFYKNEKALLKRARNADPTAQRMIYDMYSPKMLSVCRQYIRDLQFAEDAMINGFVKVFKGLHSFREEGSFEGWISRIMIRESISFLRKKQFVVFDEEIIDHREPTQVEIDGNIDVELLQLLIDDLPEGYKMVFVLHAIEGYKHAEIAEMLDISENTSKSQLFKARRWLQKRITEQNRLGYGTRRI